MRTFFAVAIATALLVSAVYAADVDSDSDVDAEVEHPTLPGLGAACYPKPLKARHWAAPKFSKTQFLGTCVRDGACTGAGSSEEHGYCAGIGVVCCRAPNVDVGSNMAVEADVKSAPATQPQSPNPAAVVPGASTVLRASTPAASGLTQLIKIPTGINGGLSIAGASFNNAKVGSPGCPLTKACFSCGCAVKNAKIKNNLVTLAVTPSVRITGLKPFVEAVKRAFDAMKASGKPEVVQAYNQVKSAGGLCCRPIKRSNGTPGSGYSNHSWGMAVDFYFGGSIDPRGDGKTQRGLSLMAPYFNAQKLYWAAGFRGSEEDAMHFEASQQAINAWIAAKLIK